MRCVVLYGSRRIVVVSDENTDDTKEAEYMLSQNPVRMYHTFHVMCILKLKKRGICKIIKIKHINT